MNYKNIGSRLLMAASLIECGKTVCDVGCDHGKLSLYLVKENKAQHVIATDINQKPLQKAVDLFKQHGISDKAEFILTDGLQGIQDTQNITHVVIAGLGGETMAQVIENAPFIKTQKTKLVLVPAQSGAKIRKYLYQNGFDIISENTVAEKKKFYTAITAQYTGKIKCPTVYNCYIGESEMCKTESAKGYFEMVFSQLEKQKNGQIIDNGNCEKEITQALERVKELIENLQK